MTGKELIMYILEHDLLDEDVVQDDIPIFLMTLNDAAVKFGVGPSTLGAWAARRDVDWCRIDGTPYIYKNAKDPRK